MRGEERTHHGTPAHTIRALGTPCEECTSREAETVEGIASQNPIASRRVLGHPSAAPSIPDVDVICSIVIFSAQVRTRTREMQPRVATSRLR